MQFEWNPEKAEANLRKHGVSFEEEHSDDEKRNGIVGHSTKTRLLIISYTEKENDTFRIISARETTLRERRKYENENG